MNGVLRVILDACFRRDNLTNSWQRAPDLQLAFDLDTCALNGVALGEPFERLSFLGRDNWRGNFFDLGLEVGHDETGVIANYALMFADPTGHFAPFAGRMTRGGSEIELAGLRLPELPEVFGAWYWLDLYKGEALVFYETDNGEYQLEFDRAGGLITATFERDPIMANPAQRKAYGVTRPWPPA